MAKVNKNSRPASKIAPQAPLENELDELLDDAPATQVAGDGIDAPLSAAPRVYKGTQEVDHDLFKLKVAVMRKNVSFTDIPDYVPIEHCHTFHTVDSNGKKQTTSNPVGGHHHEIEVINVKDGVPTLRVSPPMKFVRERVAGRTRKIAVEVEGDSHTHEVEYLGSERIRLRATNAEFAKLDAAIRARQNPVVEGVTG